MFLFVRK